MHIHAYINITSRNMVNSNYLDQIAPQKKIPRYPLVNFYRTNWKDPPCYQWVNHGKSTISTGSFFNS